MKKSLIILIAMIFILYGCDSSGSSSDDAVDSTGTQNTKPAANAGVDQTVKLNDAVQLDGSGSSDADGDALTYSWSITSLPDGSGVTLSDSEIVNPAFTPDIEGDYTIQLTVNDGTENSEADSVIISVSDSRIYGLNPSYSADGSKIVFDDNMSDIFIIDADGTDLTNLTNSQSFDSAPSISPDGTKIVFSRNDGNQKDIFIMDIDGSNPGNLTNTPDSNEAYPSWSNDGNYIVFTTGGDSDEGVYTIKKDGTERTYLTNMGGTGTSWAPNSKILYVSGSIINGVTSDDIFVCNSDGSGIVNLSYNTRWDEDPCWSPDGTKIAFDSGVSQDNDIYVMDSDGSNPVNVTNDSSHYCSTPAWSPDGLKIIFSCNTYLYIMDSDGSNMVPFSKED